MLDPEAAGLLVGAGEGQGVALVMGEEGGVEVAAQTPLFAELHPLFKVFGLQLVPVRPAAVVLVKNGVAGVQVHLGLAGDQRQHLIQVVHQLLGGAGPSGVIAGGLDAAGEGLGGVAVKAADVVPLPAVQADRDLFQGLDGGLGVHAQGHVLLSCFGIMHQVFLLCTGVLSHCLSGQYLMDIKAPANAAAGVGQVCQLPCADQLHRQIANGSSLHRPGIDRQARSPGSHPV